VIRFFDVKNNKYNKTTTAKTAEGMAACSPKSEKAVMTVNPKLLTVKSKKNYNHSIILDKLATDCQTDLPFRLAAS